MFTQARHPERVFLREGSPGRGTTSKIMPHSGEPSRKRGTQDDVPEAKRRAQEDVPIKLTILLKKNFIICCRHAKLLLFE